MTIEELLRELLGPSGAVVLLLLLVYAGARGLLVPRSSHEEIVSGWRERYEEMRADRNDWRKLALGGTEIADSAVGVAERVAGP